MSRLGDRPEHYFACLLCECTICRETSHFLCRKTKHDDDVGLKARAKTHASVRPTHVPSWEEMISVEIDDAKAENEGDCI